MPILEIQLPIPSENVVFPFPIHQLNDRVLFQTYLVQILSLLDVPVAYSETIAPELASFILRFTEENRGENFHLTAIIEDIEHTVTTGSDDSVVAELTMVVEEPPPRLRMEKLEQNEKDLGDCTICLNEINCKNNEVVKISCGHVYYKSCLVKWLKNCNSCPLCRAPLPLEEGSQ